MIDSVINSKTRLHKMVCVSSGAIMRYFMQGAEPMFLASDVCKALSFRNVQFAMSCLQADEKAMAKVNGFVNLQHVVNQCGLWELMEISKQRLDRPFNAKVFERWLLSDIFSIVRPMPSFPLESSIGNQKADKELTNVLQAIECSHISIIDAVKQLVKC